MAVPIHTVVITHLEDKPKARATTQCLGSFRSQRRARERADEELFAIVCDKLVDCFDSDIWLYWEGSSEETVWPHSSLDKDLVRRDLDKLVARFSRGLYVSCTFSVEVQSNILDEESE